MIRPVLRMGEPLLLDEAVTVQAFGTAGLRMIVADMWDTMDEEGGIGIAAPQIGLSYHIICFGTHQSESATGEAHVPRTVLINPEVEVLGEETSAAWEGCLSVPGLRGKVTRPAKIRYRGFDMEGNVIERTAAGLHARVVQHEADHLKGILYPMRVTDWYSFGYEDVLFPRKHS